ncbi:hypothetical protein V8E55_010446 [Tylopilus felleus]
MVQRNPHLEAQPDYALPEFVDAILIFTVEGKSDLEAAALLTEVWRFSHERACALWDQEQADQARILREEHERLDREEEQACAAREQEQELSRQEERKKHKNKFLPIPNNPLPSHALFIPPQHALNKLRKGEYVSLYYFTNKGIREAEEEAPNLDDDVLTLVRSEKGPVFQSTAAVKSKDCKVHDEDLSWEEFSEANYRMLKAMRQQDWPNECTNMMCDFWLALEGHDFCHGECEYGKHALLLHQACVCKQWHQAIGTPDAFSLMPLSEYHLLAFQKKLRDAALNSQIETLRKVGAIPVQPSDLPHFVPFFPPPSFPMPLCNVCPNPIPNPHVGLLPCSHSWDVG